MTNLLIRSQVVDQGGGHRAGGGGSWACHVHISAQVVSSVGACEEVDGAVSCVLLLHFVSFVPSHVDVWYTEEAMATIYRAAYVSLHVRKSNRAALALYKDTLGFTVQNIEKGYCACTI